MLCLISVVIRFLCIIFSGPVFRENIVYMKHNYLQIKKMQHQSNAANLLINPYQGKCTGFSLQQCSILQSCCFAL